MALATPSASTDPAANYGNGEERHGGMDKTSKILLAATLGCLVLFGALTLFTFFSSGSGFVLDFNASMEKATPVKKDGSYWWVFWLIIWVLSTGGFLAGFISSLGDELDYYLGKIGGMFRGMRGKGGLLGMLGSLGGISQLGEEALEAVKKVKK